MRGIYAFDEADEALTFMPVAVRRALDHAGRKLGLSAWQRMPHDARRELVSLGADDAVDVVAVRALVEGAPEIEPRGDPDAPPPGLAVSGEVWSRLRPLDRYALVKVAHKPEKLARAWIEISAKV